MKFYSNGRLITYNLSFSELDRELRKKYRAKKISFKELWDFRPACGIDDTGNQVELSDEEKTVELFTEGEISSGNISCYVIDNRAVLQKYFRSPLSSPQGNIVLGVEFDKEMNVVLDYYCHTSYFGGIFDYISSRRKFQFSGE